MTIQLIIDSKFNSIGVRQAEQELRKMMTGLDDLFKTSQANMPSLNQLFDSFGSGVGGNIEERIGRNVAALDQYAAKLRVAADEQFAMGHSAEALNLQGVASQVESLANAFRKSSEESKNQSTILDFINNKFNKFAFGLFVVTGALNTVARAFQQVSKFMLEGASIADRANAFNVLLEDAGINANALQASLREASQGALTLDAAMRPTLQLMKANVPGVAEMSDELLRIATASAILSGDLSQTESIYTTLIRGIVRGSPRLIDNADIYLKLGDAVESYAARIDKTVEELTPEDKITATAEAVRDQGQAIVDLAEQVDSSALVIKSFTTDMSNAWNELKSAIGSGFAKFLTALDDLADVFDPVIIGLAKLITGSESMGLAMEKALEAAPLQTFAKMFTSTLDILGAYIRGYGAEMTEVWNAFVSTIVTGATLIAEGFRMITSGNYEEGVAKINEQFAVFSQKVLDAANSTNQINTEVAAAKERAREAGEAMGLYGTTLQDDIVPEIDAAAAAQARLNETLGSLSAGIEDAIEARTGPDAQFADRRVEIEEDLRDRIIDINKELAEKLSSISSDLKDELVGLSNKYKDDVASVAADTAEKLQDIDEGLAEKLSDITDGASKDREEANRARNKGIETAHENHQKKLLDIERKYEAARLKALIDRDARALFEAEQNRKQGQEEANDDLNTQIKEEEETLKEKIEEINKLEAERRADEIEAAEKRRQDALEAQAQKLADLKNSYAKEKQEAIAAANEQRQEEIKAANDKRADAAEHHANALRELDEWYAEQLLLQKERQLQEKISELEHFAEMSELTQQHLDDLRSMYNDYNNSVSAATTPTVNQPGGLVNDPQPGGGGTTGRLLPNAGRSVVGGTQQFGSMRLQINSNDRTLEQVLRSSTYDYMIEALDE